MSVAIVSKPSTPLYRDNFDRVFRDVDWETEKRVAELTRKEFVKEANKVEGLGHE